MALRQDHIGRVIPIHIIPSRNFIFRIILLWVARCMVSSGGVLDLLNELYILIHYPLREEYTPLCPGLCVRLLILPLVFHTPGGLSLRVVV